MNDILEKLIKQLPKQELKDSKKKKIYKLFPVPKNYKIMWAEITSLGGYPSGIVLTDIALIIKASKADIKSNKVLVKKNNKNLEKKDRVKPAKVIYNIIPWDYYDPEEYEVEIIKDKKENNKYIIKAGENRIAEFQNKSLFTFFESYKAFRCEEIRKVEEIIENSAISSVNTINAKGTMFNAAYGADQTKTGHGIYAEEAGSILDKLSGEKSTVVGRDNAKNGPDKIVDTIPVQCKYCKTAYASVNNCFKKNASGEKIFRYFDLNGNPMKVEVPSDQYTQAIELMKKYINQGQVPGINDPNAAYEIIRKGKLTYNQVLNLAKAGTIESLVYDVGTGAITCLSALGITSMVTFAQVLWSTRDYKKAAKYALKAGIQVYGLSFAGNIIASQISRTSIGNSIKPLVSKIANKMSNTTVQGVINSFRALAGKKAIYGAAAQKSFVKYIGTNAITEGVFFIVFSIPDSYRVISGKISGAQYVKNMLSLAASIVGTIGFTMGTGALLGKTVGEEVNKKAGSAIGMLVGGGGGLLFGTGAKIVSNIVREDDAVITTRMFNAFLSNMCIEYMLNEKEFDELIESLNHEEKELRKLQFALLKEDDQIKVIDEFLRPKFDSIISNRVSVTNKDEKILCDNMNSLVIQEEIENDV